MSFVNSKHFLTGNLNTSMPVASNYRETSNTKHIVMDNEMAGHSDVLGTVSSFSTQHVASMD